MIIQIFSGAPPFADTLDVFLFRDVVNHQRRPQRPDNPTALRGRDDSLWALIEQCWSQQPSSRPTASDVSAFLNTFQRQGPGDPSEPDLRPPQISSSPPTTTNSQGGSQPLPLKAYQQPRLKQSELSQMTEIEHLQSDASISHVPSSESNSESSSLIDFSGTGKCESLSHLLVRTIHVTCALKPFLRMASRVRHSNLRIPPIIHVYYPSLVRGHDHQAQPLFPIVGY
jgi:hypothetical protein